MTSIEVSMMEVGDTQIPSLLLDTSPYLSCPESSVWICVHCCGMGFQPKP